MRISDWSSDVCSSDLITRFKYKLYDRIVAISACIGEVLQDSGVPAEKVRVVRSAFTPEAITPLTREQLRIEFGLPADAFVIAVVAQLIRRKGHSVLLDAMPRLLAAIPKLQVLFSGQESLHAELSTTLPARNL